MMNRCFAFGLSAFLMVMAAGVSGRTEAASAQSFTKAPGESFALIWIRKRASIRPGAMTISAP